MKVDVEALASGIRFIPEKLKEISLSDLLVPNCQKCGQPMSFEKEEQRWYCFRDNLALTANEQAGRSSQKPKREWGRILVATLSCAIPFSNPLFFLFAYDKLRLRRSKCPHCRSTDREVLSRTLRLRNNRFDILLEYRCPACGTVWHDETVK